MQQVNQLSNDSRFKVNPTNQLHNKKVTNDRNFLAAIGNQTIGKIVSMQHLKTKEPKNSQISQIKSWISSTINEESNLPKNNNDIEYNDQ